MAEQVDRGDTGLIPVLIGDGRPPLSLSAMALILAGGFAIFLGVRNEFLPHDVAFLGMTPQQLCTVNECRIVHFMVHDRISFGGALVAIGTVYLWLIHFPLAAGERWAWRLLAASGAQGFASFLAYLGYGYLDTWHAVATALLLPCFLVGLVKSRALVHYDPPRPRLNAGRAILFLTALGMAGGGVTILIVGMTCVFVPEDLAFMGITPAELEAINPRLIPLIAHDRAGFGGAVLCCGLLAAGCVWYGRPSRAWRQTMALAGVAGFATAVGVHPAIGYTDWWHLLPAVAGASGWALGLFLVRSEDRVA
jgi:hypothetical protein